MHDDGVIKFSCDWQQTEQLDCSGLDPVLDSLISVRDQMVEVGFIGVYPDGIGYGNISHKISPREFIISGTQTGHLRSTNPDHYTRVDAWDIEQNSLHCTGPVKASSESLTHAALYEARQDIQAIIHIHHAQLWQTSRDQLPTTGADVPYGTPAMAHEMWRLFRESRLAEQKILVMAGHEDGMIAVGQTLDEAASRLLSLKK
ncbi:MAG: class II aldolase/adducin family protein [Elainellaceae cyanobacterium]